MATKRIYIVECKCGDGHLDDKVTLVRAKSTAEAREQVASVRVASQDDLVRLLRGGHNVIDVQDAPK
jgi:hypothetical protein